MRFLPLVVLCVLGAAPLLAQETMEPAEQAQAQAEASSNLPFFMPTPEGWRKETIPFPLAFAPELKYEGLEELRFAPGMFEEHAEDYWTYAFVWWLDSDAAMTARQLTQDLQVYFRGLTQAVAQSQEFDAGSPIFHARLKESQEVPSRATRSFEGDVETYDTFVTRKPVTLNMRVTQWSCEEQDRRVVFFEMSPQPKTHSVWKKLAEVRDRFQCASKLETPLEGE